MFYSPKPAYKTNVPGLLDCSPIVLWTGGIHLRLMTTAPASDLTDLTSLGEDFISVDIFHFSFRFLCDHLTSCQVHLSYQLLSSYSNVIDSYATSFIQQTFAEFQTIKS